MTDERGGRYFREARFFLAGDKVAAQSHILEARSLMGYMRDMQAMGGPPIQVQYATLQDGTRIKATMMNGQYQAEIVSPAHVTEQRKTGCDDFLSGLLLVSALVERVRDDTGEVYYVMEWFYPVAEEVTEAGDKVALEQFAKPAVVETYGAVYASDYSGAMRQAVQLWLGMGVSLGTMAGFLRVPKFNFAYEGTHGLVRKQGSPDEAPEFYMVRMPTGAHGILATEFPVCHGVTEEQAEAGLTWIPFAGYTFPEDIDLAIEDGSVKEIMSAAVFEAAVGAGYGPLYMDCGWAFSLSGHECQNVLYAEPTDRELYTKRVKIAFMQGEGGLAGLSANAASAPPARYAGSAGALPRFPWKLPDITTLLPTMELIGYPTAANVIPINCDVHVFYKGDDEQVFGLVSSPPTTEQTQDGNVHAALVVDGVLTIGNYSGKLYNPGGTFAYYTLNGESVNQYQFSGSGVEMNFDQAGGGGYKAPFIDMGDLVFQLDTMVYRTNAWSKVFGIAANYYLLMVPFHQREGAYVLDAGWEDFEAYTLWPSAFDACTTGSTYWDITTGVCEDGSGLKRIIGTRTKPESTTHATEPPVSTYVQTFGSGGQGLASPDGCMSGIDLGPPAILGDPDALPVTMPAEVVWSGGMKFYSSGEDPVNVSWGSSSAPMGDNFVAQRVIEATSIDYLTNGSSEFIFGWTDGIHPEKHIVSTKVNSAKGADTINNTEYPLPEIDGWAKVFIGNANPTRSEP